MLTAEEYNEIQQHRQAIDLFKNTGQWIGSTDLFSIYERITDAKVNRSCANCMAEAVISVYKLIKEYEK